MWRFDNVCGLGEHLFTRPFFISDYFWDRAEPAAVDRFLR